MPNEGLIKLRCPTISSPSWTYSYGTRAGFMIFKP